MNAQARHPKRRQTDAVMSLALDKASLAVNKKAIMHVIATAG
jgi:hypothetical protein